MTEETNDLSISQVIPRTPGWTGVLLETFIVPDGSSREIAKALNLVLFDWAFLYCDEQTRKSMVDRLRSRGGSDDYSQLHEDVRQGYESILNGELGESFGLLLTMVTRRLLEDQGFWFTVLDRHPEEDWMVPGDALQLWSRDPQYAGIRP
jgi:hypothetical protein